MLIKCRDGKERSFTVSICRVPGALKAVRIVFCDKCNEGFFVDNAKIYENSLRNHICTPVSLALLKSIKSRKAHARKEKYFHKIRRVCTALAGRRLDTREGQKNILIPIHGFVLHSANRPLGQYVSSVYRVNDHGKNYSDWNYEWDESMTKYDLPPDRNLVYSEVLTTSINRRYKIYVYVPSKWEGILNKLYLKAIAPKKKRRIKSLRNIRRNRKVSELKSRFSIE